MVNHIDETRTDDIRNIGSECKSSPDHRHLLHLDNFHQDTMSHESDNFVDIETMNEEESELSRQNFVELEADSNETTFNFCKNPFSQWFL